MYCLPVALCSALCAEVRLITCFSFFISCGNCFQLLSLASPVCRLGWHESQEYDASRNVQGAEHK